MEPHVSEKGKHKSVENTKFDKIQTYFRGIHPRNPLPKFEQNQTSGFAEAFPMLI